MLRYAPSTLGALQLASGQSVQRSSGRREEEKGTSTRAGSASGVGAGRDGVTDEWAHSALLMLVVLSKHYIAAAIPSG